MIVCALIREYHDTHTYGVLHLPSGTEIQTLELPWLDNRTDISRYPAGVYDADWLPRSASGKYTRVWHIKDVPGRSGILVHAGNVLRHTLGCTLVGMRRGTIAGQVAVLDSVKALNVLRDELGGKDFVLVVI